MRTQNSAIQMHDLARLHRARPQPPHNIPIAAIRYKTDILTVRLVRDRKPVFMRQRARLILAHPAKGKAQIIKLRGCGCKQEIGLILCRVGTAMQFGPVGTINALHIMAGGKAISLQIARCLQKIGEFDCLVTAHTGDRRLAAQIAVGEILHHLVMKPAFIIQHIMGNPQPRRDRARIMDIGTRATGALGLNGDPMVI